MPFWKTDVFRFLLCFVAVGLFSGFWINEYRQQPKENIVLTSTSQAARDALEKGETVMLGLRGQQGITRVLVVSKDEDGIVGADSRKISYGDISLVGKNRSIPEKLGRSFLGTCLLPLYAMVMLAGLVLSHLGIR